MMPPDKNPYVILGVDYGCSLDEARRGFVRAVRRARTAPEPEFTEEDVTSALHAVEQVVLDPEGSVEAYRIPSDPSVFHLHSEGLFAAQPVPLSRRTPSLSDAELDRLTCSGLASAIDLCLAELSPSGLVPPIAYGGESAGIDEATRAD